MKVDLGEETAMDSYGWGERNNSHPDTKYYFIYLCIYLLFIIYFYFLQYFLTPCLVSKHCTTIELTFKSLLLLKILKISISISFCSTQILLLVISQLVEQRYWGIHTQCQVLCCPTWGNPKQHKSVSAQKESTAPFRGQLYHDTGCHTGVLT